MATLWLALFVSTLAAPACAIEEMRTVLEAQHGPDVNAGPEEGLPVGSDDHWIRVIPSLSTFLEGNGGRLTLQALVKSRARVAWVEASIKGVGRLELKPASSILCESKGMRGMADLVTTGVIGFYQAEWLVSGLARDKTYPVALHVADVEGHRITDKSLSLSVSGMNARRVDRTAPPGGAGLRPVRAPAQQVGSCYYCSAVIDPAGGYAYFGTATAPGRVVKVRLSDFTRVGFLTLNPGENFLYSAVIDPSGRYAYFGTSASATGMVVKVRLADLKRVEALTLNSGEHDLRSAVIDPAGDYACFGTATMPGRVVKVRLSDFTRAGALTLSPGEHDLRSAVIDPAGRHAYFGTFTAPGMVVKVRLPDLARVGALQFHPGENYLPSAVMAPAGKYAYWGTATAPGRVVKVRLSDFTRMGVLRLNPGENDLRCAVIDPSGRHAYFGTYAAPGMMARVRLADFTYAGALKLSEGKNGLDSAAIDPSGRYACFGMSSAPNQAFRVAVHQNAVDTSPITLFGHGSVSGVLFYGHALQGNLRLALYDDQSPSNLLWQSDTAAGVATGDWLAMPLSAGAPQTLSLPPGNYWLAWRGNNTPGVLSRDAGPEGESPGPDPAGGTFPAAIERNVMRLSNDWGAETIRGDRP